MYLPSSLFLCSRDVRMQSAGLSRHESSRTSGLNTSSVDLVVFFCLVVVVLIYFFFHCCYDCFIPCLEAQQVLSIKAFCSHSLLLWDETHQSLGVRCSGYNFGWGFLRSGYRLGTQAKVVVQTFISVDLIFLLFLRGYHRGREKKMCFWDTVVWSGWIKQAAADWIRTSAVTQRFSGWLLVLVQVCA